MSHYESTRLCQNDVVASHYESSACVVPAGGPMLLAGLTDTLQGMVNLTVDVSIFAHLMHSLTASTPIPSTVMSGQGQYAGRP